MLRVLVVFCPTFSSPWLHTWPCPTCSACLIPVSLLLQALAHTQTSGPLHMLSAPPGMPFCPQSAWHLIPQESFRHHLHREASPKRILPLFLLALNLTISSWNSTQVYCLSLSQHMKLGQFKSLLFYVILNTGTDSEKYFSNE